MALYPVNGCKFYIGTVLEEQTGDMDATDFSAITWTEVKRWTEMGSYGDGASLITDSIIGEGRDKKAKGTRNAGSMSNAFAVLPTDPGQIALIAAERSANNYAFKIELNDKPVTGAAPKNSLRYFVGLVMSAQESGGSGNTNRRLMSTIEINSNIVRVAASAT